MSEFELLQLGGWENKAEESDLDEEKLGEEKLDEEKLDENIEDKLVKRKERTVDDDYCGMAVKSLTAVIKEDLEQVEGDEKEWLDLDIGNGVYGEGKLLGQLCVSMRYKEGPLELMHA